MLTCTHSFTDLNGEHAAFLQFLAKHESRDAPPSIEALHALAFLLEEIHHKKEEEFLLPLLENHPALNIGGPKCMTFFTPRVLGAGWKDSYQEVRGALAPFDPANEAHPSPFRQRVWTANSMLKIPLEDHMAGAKALTELCSSTSSLTPFERAELYSKFVSLLRDHVQREEECLFQLYSRELTEEQKREYEERARLFDEKMKTKALIRRLIEY